MIYQQGDVLMECVDSIPMKAKTVKRENGRIVLARGESTGHAHVIDASDVVAMELDGALYLSVTGDVIVKHEEHKPVTLPVGDYVVRKVLEYDHFTEEAREVVD